MILALVVTVLLVAGIGVVWVERQISPGGKPGAQVAVRIPAGASTAEIGTILARAGVIHDATLFRYYVSLKGEGPLYPGTWHLPKDSSYSAVIRVIDHPAPLVVEKLVIPEGYTLDQIAQSVAALPRLHLSAAKFLAAATNGQVRSPYEPAGVNDLEGLLFPATYDIKAGDTEVDVLEEMVGAFDDRAQAIGLAHGAAALGLSPYQVVTVASIVEHEAKLAADRGAVASVIYNRLKVGMPLGADSTQTYYLRLVHPTVEPTVAQLDQPSPYNTRLNKGLPPSPIGSVSLASLEAATTPPATHYLYFVEVNPDGQLGFASTNSGFVQLQAECRAAKLC
ncbi:MAG: endolytic transglycosylase MltG [Acidimicrobiales bacterium]